MWYSMTEMAADTHEQNMGFRMPGWYDIVRDRQNVRLFL
jgi:hypothetical protein